LPLLVRVIVCELLLPTVMVPKLTLVGLAAICGWVPVPLSGIDNGLFVALLVIVTLAPLTAPAVVGANVTVRVADCPDVS
jgi:hypothetical protein